MALLLTTALSVSGCSDNGDGGGSSRPDAGDAGDVADMRDSSVDGGDLAADLVVSDISLESIPPHRIGRDDFYIRANVANNGEDEASSVTCSYRIEPTEATTVGPVTGDFELAFDSLPPQVTKQIEQDVHIIAEDETPNYNARFVVSCSAANEPRGSLEDNEASAESSVIIQ